MLERGKVGSASTSAHSWSLPDGNPQYKTDKALFFITFKHTDFTVPSDIWSPLLWGRLEYYHCRVPPNKSHSVDASWILCCTCMVPVTRNRWFRIKDHLSLIPLTQPIENMKYYHSRTTFTGSKTSVQKCEAEGLGTKFLKRTTTVDIPLLQVFNILSLDRYWLLV